MFINHLYKTPLKKKSQTISYDEESQQINASHEHTKNKVKFDQLYSKFSSINSTIDIDMTKNNFNLIDYDREDQRIKYDPQMMTAKLRRLENMAQINLISHELQRRRKKKHNPFKLPPNQYENSTYKKTYQQFLKNNKLIDMPANDSQSEQDEKQPKPKGISRFHQLKRHSKILQFTLQKIKEREQNNMKQQKQFIQRKSDVRSITNQLKDYGEYSQAARKKISSTVKVSAEYNPQVIIEDKFKRIMTMKAKDKVSDEVKKNPRCNKMMNIQNDILLELEQEERSLSKQNMKKLKSRFIEIVNELQKGDRKRKENKFLPSIDLTSLTERAMPKKNQALNFDKLASKTIYRQNLEQSHVYQNGFQDQNQSINVEAIKSEESQII